LPLIVQFQAKFSGSTAFVVDANEPVVLDQDIAGKIVFYGFAGLIEEMHAVEGIDDNVVRTITSPAIVQARKKSPSKARASSSILTSPSTLSGPSAGAPCTADHGYFRQS
jgi:hypothetical protein